MASAAERGFENGRLAACFDAVLAGVRELVAVLNGEVQSAGDELRAEHLLEQAHRMIGAAQVANLARIDAGGLHRVDGHRSAAAHARHALRISGAEASRRVRAGRALRDLPEVAEAAKEGLIGPDHVQVIAGIHANPRIRAQVPARQEKFLAWAAEESFDDFQRKALDWARCTDLDGGFRDNERHHCNRNFRFGHNELEGSWEPSGHFGADQGARMEEIHRHYVDALWQADWAEARARLGEAATAADLARTDAQRRADALEQIFNDAAGAPPGTTAPPIVHNIVWSAEAYLAMLELLGGDHPVPLGLHWSDQSADPTGERACWCDPDTYRCSTIDGVPLEPVEQFASSLANHVRRVVVTARGVVIDLGQRARLFTGSARLAAQLQHPRCVWPGCDVPTTRCEIDHLHPHARGGPTNPGNGAPLCGFHNRWKQKGFATGRDPGSGRWRTYRHDACAIE